MSLEKSLETLKTLHKKFDKKELNESDTRFQIIDKILKDTFYWPESNIITESITNVGYTDYQLTSNGKTFLVIEAKKEKLNFNFSEYKEISNNKIKVKVLMKDKNTEKTILQVKNYCNDIGCKYACITNGHEWAFFRIYIENQSWQDGNAYIIKSLEDFINKFEEINKYFTYNKIVNEFSFKKLFDGVDYSSTERYEVKRFIKGYTEQIENNHIETLIRGYFDKYFGEITIYDKELLEKCYVQERGYSLNFDKVTSLLEDALSPYMIKKLENISISDKYNNTLSDKIIETVRNEKKSKVLILFGGKGSGKTTFLVSLFNNERNSLITKNSIIAHINLLKVANDKEAIKKEIFRQLIDKLDIEKLLHGSNKDLEKLFKDRFEVELRQSLEGFNPESEYFLKRRSELFFEYKKDYFYCLERLAYLLRNENKAIIVNIDNTDQFDQSIQDYCFSLANELSEKLSCIVIISLREERFVTSSIEGYLDAYEKNGFHISSPNPQQVFLKRLDFIRNKINIENKINEKNKSDINKFFNVLENNLKNDGSEFNKFMTAATHGNIRQGLELFKNILFSKYTNVIEMIKEESWYITLHHILKPIMTPIYRFYDETTSNSIPNIFRLRSESNSSHFTAYRILDRLSRKNNTYVSSHEIKAYFIENFNMIDDYKENMDILLKMGMIESENGIDKYQEDLQQIKISAFGYYMKNVICKDFSYLELIASDLTFLDKQVSNQIIKYSNDEYDLLVDGQNRDISDHEKNYLRYKRLKVRISKTKKLISYFEEQELLELKKYEFSKDTLIIKKIKEQIEEQIVHKILPSAKKNFNIKEEEDTTKNGIARL